MVIRLTSDIETALAQAAQRQGTTPGTVRRWTRSGSCSFRRHRIVPRARRACSISWLATSARSMERGKPCRKTVANVLLRDWLLSTNRDVCDPYRYGPLVALINRNDPHHAVCVAAARILPTGPMVTTWPCLTEAMYLLHRIGGYAAQTALWRFLRDGRLVLHDLDSGERDRMEALMDKYRDKPMDLADASIVAAAEHLDLGGVYLSLDSDFCRVYRLADGSMLDSSPLVFLSIQGGPVHALCVVGSVALDSVETPTEKRDNVLGGSAVFFSYAASFFTTVRLAGVVGEDWPRASTPTCSRHAASTRPACRSCPAARPSAGAASTCENMNDRETLDLQLNVWQDFDPVLPESYRRCKFLFLANGSPVHPDAGARPVPGPVAGRGRHDGPLHPHRAATGC